MHGTNLARWVATMTDCLNRGDELAIYAMCDMLKWHAFVITSIKPWTTVDTSIATLMIPELCIMCDVRLIYLGNNKYGEIKCKLEVLSLLPKLIQSKQESPVTLPSESLALAPRTQARSDSGHPWWKLKHPHLKQPEWNWIKSHCASWTNLLKYCGNGDF